MKTFTPAAFGLGALTGAGLAMFFTVLITPVLADPPATTADNAAKQLQVLTKRIDALEGASRFTPPNAIDTRLVALEKTVTVHTGQITALGKRIDDAKATAQNSLQTTGDEIINGLTTAINNIQGSQVADETTMAADHAQLAALSDNYNALAKTAAATDQHVKWVDAYARTTDYDLDWTAHVMECHVDSVGGWFTDAWQYHDKYGLYWGC